MPSAVSRRGPRITSVCSRVRLRLWPCSDAPSCLIARHAVAFLPPWIRRVWKRCAACSCRTRWPAQDQPRAWEVCGIGKDNDGWSSSLVGTRQAARQRALPQSPDLPPPQRRLQAVCAPGYTGRKRGEVVRTRTTLLQAHPHQWLATFGNAGNADYPGELRRGLEVIVAYQAKLGLSQGQALIRLDGQYGNGAIVAHLLAAQIPWLMRGKDYGLLDLAQVKAHLALPADEQFVHPESGLCRDLFECGALPVTAQGHRSRVIIATH